MTKYTVVYGPFPGRAELARNILIYAGADWSDKLVKGSDSDERDKAPNGVFPYLIEEEEGKEPFILSDAGTIERYLARKFDLLGDTPQEALLIESYHAHIMRATDALISYGFGPVEDKERAKAVYEERATTLAKHHERILARNHDGNGYYIGERLSLADLATVGLISAARRQGMAGPISEEAAPLLNKVFENVEHHPKTAVYYDGFPGRILQYRLFSPERPFLNLE